MNGIHDGWMVVPENERRVMTDTVDEAPTVSVVQIAPLTAHHRERIRRVEVDTFNPSGHTLAISIELLA
jgi:hypothetical protein